MKKIIINLMRSILIFNFFLYSGDLLLLFLVSLFRSKAIDRNRRQFRHFSCNCYLQAKGHLIACTLELVVMVRLAYAHIHPTTTVRLGKTC